MRRKTFQVALELFGSSPVGEAPSAIQPNKLLKRECADWAMGWHSEVLVGTPGAHVDCDWRVRAMHRHVGASKWMLRSSVTTCEHSFLDMVS